MQDKLESLEAFATTIFASSTQKKYLEHSKRVLAYAKSIGKAEGASTDILLPAALLHDIGYTVDASFQGHAGKSVILARGALLDLGYDEASIDRIVQAVGSHHPEPGAMLNSIEEKVLYDADNMEIIGVFGSLRWIGTFPSTTAELVSSIDLFLSIVDKCVSARGSLFFTETARRIGDKSVRETVYHYQKIKEYIAQFGHSENPLPISF